MTQREPLVHQSAITAEMIERAARALIHPGGFTKWDHLNDDSQENFRRAAERALIAAEEARYAA